MDQRKEDRDREDAARLAIDLLFPLQVQSSRAHAKDRIP